MCRGTLVDSLNMFSEPVQSRGEQREATRRRVIAVADRLFREQGFTATSIRQIAAEAGVSTGTVIAVGDKSTLLASVFESSIAALQSEHAERPDAIPDARTTAERIASLFLPFLTLFARDQELSREYAAVLVRGAHDSAIFTQMADELMLTISAELERAGQTAGRAAAASRTIYLSYLGILFSWAGSDSDVPTALSDLAAAISTIAPLDESERT